jgi:hypothetical protein
VTSTYQVFVNANACNAPRVTPAIAAHLLLIYSSKAVLGARKLRLYALTLEKQVRSPYMQCCKAERINVASMLALCGILWYNCK